MIVGICGLSGSGKDEVGKVLVKKHEFVAIAFADVMKRVCMEVFNFTEEQLWGDGKNEQDERYFSGHKLKWNDAEGAYICTLCGAEFEDDIGDGEKCFALTPRFALQKLGSWGRECYPDVWAEHTLRVAQELMADKEAGCGETLVEYHPTRGILHLDEDDPDLSAPPNGVVITDVRFKNEIAAIKKAGGKVVRITRPGHEEPKWNHASETEQLEVSDEEFDYLIDNSGDLHYLGLLVDRMMDVFGGKIIPYDEEQADVPPFKRR